MDVGDEAVDAIVKVTNILIDRLSVHVHLSRNLYLTVQPFPLVNEVFLTAGSTGNLWSGTVAVHSKLSQWLFIFLLRTRPASQSHMRHVCLLRF